MKRGEEGTKAILLIITGGGGCLIVLLYWNLFNLKKEDELFNHYIMNLKNPLFSGEPDGIFGGFVGSETAVYCLY